MRTPKEIVAYANKAAKGKEAMPAKKVLVMAFMAGAYIAMGALLAICIGGGVPGIAAENPGIKKFLIGAAFPVGLMMVVIAGAELFTGNTAYFIPNVMNGRQSWKVPMKNWAIVYFGNLLGSLFIAYFITHLTQVVSGEPYIDTVMSIAEGKTSNPFYKTVLKGIGANWLVCLAMWLGMAAKDVTGKILGIWWPVMCFVTLGFEHSIANMFFIPLAMFEGADISVYDFVFNNLIGATLGNIIGGALFVGGLYWFVYDNDEKTSTPTEVTEVEKERVN